MIPIKSCASESTCESEGNRVDPLKPCDGANIQDFVLRLLYAAGAGVLAFHEINLLAAAVAFLFLYFFLPRLASEELTLKSGRIIKQVRPVLTRYFYGKNPGRRVLDVTYTCCTDNVASADLQREFNEFCLAVFESCESRKLNFAEITAELPRKSSVLTLNMFATVIRSVEFEKCDGYWKELE